MIEKVSKEVAEKDINAWLDYKNVKATKRESFKAQIDLLTESIQSGEVEVDDKTFTITQKLNTPIEGLGITELTYKPRLSVGEMRRGATNVKPMDFVGNVVANIATATGKGMSVIDKMDSADYDVAQAIAVFF